MPHRDKKKFQNYLCYAYGKKLLFRAGASNLRPRNIFVRPKLDSEFKEKSVFWPIFLRFLIDCGPNYEKKADLRPKDQLGLDAPDLELFFITKIIAGLSLSYLTMTILGQNFADLTLSPQIGTQSCFILSKQCFLFITIIFNLIFPIVEQGDKLVNFIYIYSLIIYVILTNLGLYGFTAYKIYTVQKTTKKAKSHETRINSKSRNK
jgi:hypothetical protein